MSNLASKIVNNNSSSNPTSFDELSDTPASKTGQAGKVPMVNQAEDALEYAQPLVGTDIIDNLSSTASDKALSANQGSILQSRTVVIGFIQIDGTISLLPSATKTIEWNVNNFMGIQSPVTTSSATKLSLDYPAKYEITFHFVFRNVSASPKSDILLTVETDGAGIQHSNIYTVEATASYTSSFMIDINTQDLLSFDLQLLGGSGQYDVLSSSYIKVAKYG